jgi:hypothetical protein
MTDDFSIEIIEPQAQATPAKTSWWTPAREARVLYLTVGAALSFLVFSKLQTSNTAICCGDFDGYYHIRWSRLLWENLKSGHLLPPKFTWLPLTTLNPQGYVDHHLLFHLLNIPFTWFGNLTTGAKVSATFWATLALFACFWLVQRYRVPHPLVWLLALLASSAPFVYRLSMAKAPPLSIIFMVAGIYLLFEAKYKWLAALGFLYVWTYSLFPTLLAAAGFWTLAIGWSERRFEWRPLAFAGGGILLGLIINPYFPQNFSLFFEHLFTKTGDFPVAVGQEWYPYETWELLTNSFVAMLAMLAGFVAFDWNDRERAARPLFFLLFATMLMAAAFYSRRFVEYWPPFAVLFAAFSLQPWLEGAGRVVGRLPDDVMSELEMFLDRPAAAAARRRADWLNEAELALVGLALGLLLFFALSNVFFVEVKAGTSRAWAFFTLRVVAAELLLAAGLIGYVFWRKWQGVAVAAPMVLTVILCLNVAGEARAIADDPGRDYYRAGAEWMQKNIPAGERIFNTDWDDFPRLFFFSPQHSYVSGLDPTYLYKQDPDLSKLYEDITLGKEDDPGPLIRERFGANYVFTDNQKIHDEFRHKALQSGWFEQVYRDDDCTIFKIRDKKGEPAEEPDAEPES